MKTVACVVEPPGATCTPSERVDVVRATEAHSTAQSPFAQRHALLIGAGGLGCPAAKVLADSGVGRITLVDDDHVEVSNLQRQILYSDADVGRPKGEVAATRLSRPGVVTDAHLTRLVPHNALELLEGVDVVIEGADNLPTKFLAADAAQLAGVPIVHAGAVRWGGWAMASPFSTQGHAPCLRYLFEDVPEGPTDSCEFAGVVGPVVGTLGATEGWLALRILRGDDVAGQLFTLDGLRPSFRQTTVHPRSDCPHARGTISTLQRDRYTPRES